MGRLDDLQRGYFHLLRLRERAVRKQQFDPINSIFNKYAMKYYKLDLTADNKNLIDVMSNIQSHQASWSYVFLQQSAVYALNGIQSSVENLHVTLEGNRNVMIAGLNSFDGAEVIAHDDDLGLGGCLRIS